MQKFFNKNTIEELKSISYIIILALFLRTFLFEPYYIPSISMYDNLQVGDYLIGTKYNYGYSNNSLSIPFVNYTPDLISGRILGKAPERGDVIIFKAKNTGIDERFIKRLIGLPGEKIQLINGDLYINDVKIKREFTEDIENERGDIFGKFIETLPNGRKYIILRLKINNHYVQGPENNGPAFYVPENKYFFLGDNRDQSADSRFQMGFVTDQELIAKAQIIYFSAKTNLWLQDRSFIDQISNIIPWIKSIRLDRFFTYLY